MPTTDVKVMDDIPERFMLGPYFTLVQDKKNWKYPIDIKIVAPRDEIDREMFCALIRRAIEFYAGGGATVTETGDMINGWPEIHVTAPGYYSRIGS